MNRSLLSFAAMAMVAVATCVASPFSARAGTGGGVKSETYIVIKITDEKVEYRAITKSSLKDEQKRVQDSYTERLKEWKDALKSDPQAARPVKPLIKTMPGATFQTQKGAQDYAEKLNKEEEDKKGDDKPK